MKKIVCATLCVVALIVYGQAMDRMPFFNNAEAKVVFEKITVDFKAAQEGESGMLLHLWFSLHEMKDSGATVAVFFMHNDYHRGYLKDTNQRYYSGAGEVAVYKNIKPKTAAESFEDLQIFMPYSELDLYPGDYPLAMDIKLLKNQGGIISLLTKYDFNFTKPLANTSLIPTASVDSLFAEHNVTENNKTGMRISLKKLSVSAAKNTESYVAIYFEKRDRTKLKSAIPLYQSPGGQTAVFAALSQLYEVSVWDKLSLFIPYEAFGLEKGKHDLQMDVDVIYKNWGLLKHMRFLEFQVEL